MIEHMPADDVDARLSMIATQWSLLRDAHGTHDDEAQWARQELMESYLGAIYRYLRAAVGDAALADDLAQEFAVRFLSGRFRNADPSRGRFRDYVKTCLFHLVDDYWREQQRGPRPAALESHHEPADSTAGGPASDAAFLESWREELLSRVWQALLNYEQRTGQPFHTVLRFKVENPDLSSAEAATELSATLGRKLTDANVRQLIHRARERFADVLVEETARSLGVAARDQVDEELAELNLLKYIKRPRRSGN